MNPVPDAYEQGLQLSIFDPFACWTKLKKSRNAQLYMGFDPDVDWGNVVRVWLPLDPREILSLTLAVRVDTGIIGLVTSMPGFADSFGIFSPTVHGLVVSSILLPAAFTSFFAGHLADRVGRLNAIMIGATIFGVGAALEAGSVSLGMFIPGRALAGIGEGFFLSTVVVYICEICPPERRGPVASLVQLLTTLGIPVGYFICYGSMKIKSSYSWRLPFIIQAVLATALAGFCPFLPPSPRWLIDRGRPSQAGPALERLQLSQRRFQHELESARPSTGESKGSELEQSKNRFLLVFKKQNRKQTLLGMFLMGAMQFSGIDAVLYVRVLQAI